MKGGRLSLANRLYSPFHRLFKATGNSVKKVSRRAGRVGKNVVGAVDNVGSTFAKETDGAVSNLLSGSKSRRSKRRGSRRSSRRSTTRRR